MMQFFRDHVKSGFFIVLILLIVASFALFGISEFLGGTTNQVAAKVNGEDIPVTEYQFELRQNSAVGLDPSIEQKTAVIERLIQRRLIRDGLGDLNLRPSDEAVANRVVNEPAFQENGRFNQERYANAVRLQGNTIPGFEAQLRNTIAAREFSDAINLSAIAFLDDNEDSTAVQQAKSQLQARQFSWVVLDTNSLNFSVEPTDEAVEQYYENNQSAFRLGEGVKLQYLALNLEDYSDEPTEQEVRNFYNSRIQSYTRPGQRNFNYATITTDEAIADLTLDALEEQLMASTADFSTTIDNVIAPEANSNDWTLDQGDLGDVDESIISDLFGPSIAADAFDMNESDYLLAKTGPTEYQVLYLNAIYPGEVTPLEEVSDNIAAMLAREEAFPKLIEAQEVIETAAFESPFSLEPAAEALGIDIQVSDWIYQDGQGDAALSAIPGVIAYAFDPETTADGYNSQIFETEEGIYIARFAERKPASVRSLEEVSDEISATLQNEAVSQELARRANELLDNALAEPDPEAYLASQSLTVRSTEQLTPRFEALNQYNRGIVNQAYSIEQGIQNAGIAAMNNISQAIVWVNEIVEVESDSEELQSLLDAQRAQLEQAVSSAEQSSLIGQYRENADVEIYQEQL